MLVGLDKFEIRHAYNSVHGTILRFYTNPTDFTDQPQFLHIYLTIQTFVHNVLLELSPFSLMAASFVDKVLPVLSLFFIDGGICG